MFRLRAILAVVWLLVVSTAFSNPIQGETLSGSEKRATDRFVFCHFMIGIVADRTSASDFDNDMQRAKALGIDAFALNIGVDSYTDAQLGYAYESAANNDMKVFISFDFNWYVNPFIFMSSNVIH